jgi:hypothetical protein
MSFSTGPDHLARIHPPYAGPNLAHLIEHRHARDIGGGRALWSADAWEIHYPYAKNPLPMNGSHGNWRVKSRAVGNVRDTTRALAVLGRERIPELERIAVRLVWHVVDQRDRDEDNLGRFAKAAVDGLRVMKIAGQRPLPGVVANDTADYVQREHARILYMGPKSSEVPASFFRLRVWIPGLSEEPGVPV